MPAPDRITPAQVFALIAIWSAVAFGFSTHGDPPERSLSLKGGDQGCGVSLISNSRGHSLPVTNRRSAVAS